MEITQKRNCNWQIAINHSSVMDLKDFMKIYKKCTAKPYSFLVNNITSPSDNPLRFRQNILEKRKYKINYKI